MIAAVDMNAFFPLFVSFGVVAVLAVGGYLIAMTMRQRLMKEQQTEAFTLQDLREMHARGEISDAEYERMRAMMLGKAAEKKRRAAESGQGSSPAMDDPDLGDTNAPRV